MNMRTVEFLTVMLVVAGAVLVVRVLTSVTATAISLATLSGVPLGHVGLVWTQVVPILLSGAAGGWAVRFARRYVTEQVFLPTAAAVVVSYCGAVLTPFMVHVRGGSSLRLILSVLVASLIAGGVVIGLAWQAQYRQSTELPPPTDKPL